MAVKGVANNNITVRPDTSERAGRHMNARPFAGFMHMAMLPGLRTPPRFSKILQKLTAGAQENTMLVSGDCHDE
jgi:hypothetical protein